VNLGGPGHETILQSYTLTPQHSTQLHISFESRYPSNLEHLRGDPCTARIFATGHLVRTYWQEGTVRVTTIQILLSQTLVALGKSTGPVTSLRLIPPPNPGLLQLIAINPPQLGSLQLCIGRDLRNDTNHIGESLDYNY